MGKNSIVINARDECAEGAKLPPPPIVNECMNVTDESVLL